MEIGAGIAQGIVLRPLIFTFYLNDIVHSRNHCHISLFAADCILYLDGNNWTHTFWKIQHDLSQIENWCNENALMINATKTKPIIMGSQSKLDRRGFDLKFYLNKKDILFVKHLTYLGVILGNQMNLKSLLCDVKKRISNKIFLLRKLRRYITLDSALLIYKQTIMPIFDYAGFMLLSLGVEDKKDLQIMQNDALCFCYNV